MITKNSEVHATTGEMLGETYLTLFWSPCSFLCINGKLEDFSKVKAVSDIIGHAKAMTGFIYNNPVAFSLMKKYLHGKNLQITDMVYALFLQIFRTWCLLVSSNISPSPKMCDAQAGAVAHC